jgi:hypothetical protein
MLSKRPKLTSDDVRQIIIHSADEIQDPLLKGVGRVNAEKALTYALSPLIASINAPDNLTGVDTEIEIVGTAAGSHFAGFRLEYMVIQELDNATDSEDVKWKSAGDLNNNPIFKDTLGTWDASNLDEGDYALRLKVSGEDDLKAVDMVILNVDHSPPEIAEVRFTSRINEDRYIYAVTWITDDPTSGFLGFRRAGSSSDFLRLAFSSITRQHALYLDGYLESGNYEYFISATNRANFTSTNDNEGEYYQFEIRDLWITSDGFSDTPFGIPPLHPVNGLVDFDGDGLMEIVGMKKSKWQYDTVEIYERTNGGDYDRAFESDIDFFPWAVGDTDEDGLIEILGSKGNETFLYEGPEYGAYPTERIWTAERIRGGQIADMDMDGRKEIISHHVDEDEIYIYENRGNNSYLRVARLQNPTEGKNDLSQTYAVSDFDGDGLIEIAIGDEDGDVFIYENSDDDRYYQAWTGSVKYSSIEYLAAGDFDGDGKDEFVVSSKAPGAGAQVKNTPMADTSIVAKERWIYTLFDSPDQDEYAAVWSEEILGLKSKSSLSSGDLDGDGYDEIIALVTPYIYIFKYIDTGKYQAVWHHGANETFSPIIEDMDDDGINELLFNNADNLKAFKSISTSVNLIQLPWGLTAIPIGEDQVELRWNGSPEAKLYKVYRGLSMDKLDFIASVSTEAGDTEPYEWEITKQQNQQDMVYFRDSDVKTDVEYWYAVTSVDNTGDETGFSAKVAVMPNAPPQLLSAEYIQPSGIRLTFSEGMGGSAQNESNYFIISKFDVKNTPSSAILISHKEQVMLTVDDISPGYYTIQVVSVRDDTGVPISMEKNSADFRVPTISVQEYSDLAQLIVYPNPVMSGSRHASRMIFHNLPLDTTIYIYDFNGEIIRTLDTDEQQNNRIIWYLDNKENAEVASGVYIYKAECDGDRRTGKIAVIR